MPRCGKAKVDDDMSAQFVDALLGYEYYMQTRGQATMDEVNWFLHDKNRSPIQLRTYGHYKKLISHGFRSYIPINKFDVFQSLGKLQMAADRRQYQRRPVDFPLEISRDKGLWCAARAVDISLVGFGIRTTKRFPSTPGTLIWVQMEGYEIIPTVLVWRKHEETGTRIGLRATQFIANFQLAQEEVSLERLTAVFSLRRNADSPIDWIHLVRLLEKTTELIEATADLLYTIAEFTQSSITLARPQLESIRFASPGGAEIKIDFGIADIIRTVVDALTSLGLARKRYHAENDRIEIENQKAKLEKVNLELEIMGKAVHLAKEMQVAGISDDVSSRLIEGPLREVLHLERLPARLFEKDSVERGILEARILPAAAELVSGDDPNFEIAVTNNDNKQKGLASRG